MRVAWRRSAILGVVAGSIYLGCAFMAWAEADGIRPEPWAGQFWKLVSFPLFWVMPTAASRNWEALLLANGLIWAVAVVVAVNSLLKVRGRATRGPA